MMAALLRAQSAPDDKREFPRYCAEGDLLLPVTINEHRHLCRVLDLSIGGARLMLETEAETPKPQSEAETSGETVVITFDQGDDFAAEMCWHSQQEIGVQFDFSMEALDFVSRCLMRLAPESRLLNAEITTA